ncbi:MAG: SUMF1/EgtB/PvdO family nonheme iron enzyme [Planctomycetota bacterium]
MVAFNDPDSSRTPPEAASVFRSYLERWWRDDQISFDAICAKRPELERDLRRLHAEWRALSDMLDRLDVRESLSERLRRKYGTGVDLAPPLAGDAGEEESSSPAQFLKILASHTPVESHYRLGHEIARGGMGAIFAVWDRDLNRQVAMKIMLDSNQSADPKRLLTRFLEEAQITGQLDHPGIVPVHALGLDQDGRLYFTMRLVRGRNLKHIFELVREGKEGWNQTRALGVMLKVCEAMAYAHSKGVIHRDLKPANIMVGRFGEVYVMDWGLARVLEREDRHDLRLREGSSESLISIKTHRQMERELTPDSPLVTMDGDVMGTPVYMPPEQAMGMVTELGPRSDVYSVGTMLYQVLTGEMPYVPRGAKVSSRTILMRVIEGPPRSVSELNSKVPAELAAICEKAMARDAKDRYANTLQMAEDLRAFLEGRVVRAYRTGAIAEFKKWMVRNRAIAALTAAAVLTLAIGLAATSILWGRAEQARANEATAKDQARQSARAAQDSLQEILRLSDVNRLNELRTEADKLWPELPERIEAMEQWLDEAHDVVSHLHEHEETLARLRTRAAPYDDAQREHDRATDPRVQELAMLIRERDFRSSHRVKMDDLDDQIRTRTAEVSHARSWRFEHAEEQWRHDTLAQLVEDLQKLGDPDPRVGMITDVTARLRQAESACQRAALDHVAWKTLIDAMTTDPSYHGVHIEEQVGLTPIGRDPQSKLFEFAHPRTGEVPERDGDGKLQLTGAMALVFVLLPGGTFSMGAQNSDPGGPNFDRDAIGDEGPVHEVTLAPFFISKYEMTQGQWQRFTGTNPSYHQHRATGDVRTPSPPHPVENVSWDDCRDVLRRLGLDLPTEAQWEYATRAGTTTPWWTGATKETLAGAAHLVDGDGGMYVDHSPAGRYRANGFGLHDLAGNVWEWCRDVRASYDRPLQAGDGERLSFLAEQSRVIRGGSFLETAISARSAARCDDAPANRNDVYGLRPVMAFTPARVPRPN